MYLKQMFTQGIHVHRVGPRRREGGGSIENRRTRRNKMFEISNAIKNER